MGLFDRQKAAAAGWRQMQMATGSPEKASSPPEPGSRQTLRTVPPPAEQEWQELKSRIHNALFDYLDLSRIGELSEDQVKQDVAQAARREAQALRDAIEEHRQAARAEARA